LRLAVAEPSPAALTDVAPFECCASTAPKPFADVVPRLVVAPALPAPVRLVAGAGFCGAADAGAVVLGLGELALAAELGLAIELALEVVGFDAAAVDSSEPVAVAAPALDVFEAPPAV
jgi:hypothetical protein